jgi:hypothetical protein
MSASEDAGPESATVAHADWAISSDSLGYGDTIVHGPPGGLIMADMASFSGSFTITGDIIWADPDQYPSPVPLGDAIKAMVADALSDPALLSKALIKLPQSIRDQVRIMLDALEQGSERGEP